MGEKVKKISSTVCNVKKSISPKKFSFRCKSQFIYYSEMQKNWFYIQPPMTHPMFNVLQWGSQKFGLGVQISKNNN